MSTTQHHLILIPTSGFQGKPQGYSRAILTLLGLGILLISAFVVLLLTSGRLRTALRIAPGFNPHTANKLVYYESGAEAQANKIHQFYDEAIAIIETKQGQKFTDHPRIYICSDHASFTSRIDQSPQSRVRGSAFARDVWLSPISFNYYGEDTHRESMLHELSHLHLTQQLGWLGRASDIPAWFGEALADWSAGMCSDEFSRREAVQTIRSGRTFLPDETGRLPLPKFPSDYGIPAPLLHKQARLFMDHLQSQDPILIQSLLESIYRGATFSEAFTQVAKQDLSSSWNEFISSVKSDSLSHILSYPKM